MKKKEPPYCDKYDMVCPIEHTDVRITLIEKEVMDIRNSLVQLHESNKVLIEQNERMLPINEQLSLLFTGSKALGFFGGAIMRFIILVGACVTAIIYLTNIWKK